ncbi:hypothetical protein FJQ98_04990 [Lysinibacillus agricola]|uniref:Uncharacterized protein n=1 Tax=Lysinibacillus agricola TaxID=2590012 RepID=A0ABX7AUM8_9BACI|nr:hypothetical protein [Lysinibacillus agricola]QQP13421.1 hypothetical protein FJQ98_04990 [Lysinibacillus agricola]
MTGTSHVSEAAHRTSPGSFALCESEASATMFYLCESEASATMFYLRESEASAAKRQSERNSTPLW